MPAAVVDFSNSENDNGEADLEARISKVQALLLPFKLAAKTVHDYAVGNIDHAEYVAREFPHEPEAAPEFWQGRKKGSVPAALRLRLENQQWRSSRDIERDEREQAVTLEAAQREREQQRAEQSRLLQEQQHEALEFENKVLISNVMKRFDALTPKKRREAFAEITARNDFLREHAPGGDLSKINTQSNLWLSLNKAIGALLDEWESREPKIPGLARRAAGEETEAAPPVRSTGDFASTASLLPPELAARMAQQAPAAPPKPSPSDKLNEGQKRAVSAHVNKILSDVYSLDELDEMQGEWNDEEWAPITSEVQRQLAALKRAAA